MCSPSLTYQPQQSSLDRFQLSGHPDAERRSHLMLIQQSRGEFDPWNDPVLYPWPNPLPVRYTTHTKSPLWSLFTILYYCSTSRCIMRGRWHNIILNARACTCSIYVTQVVLFPVTRRKQCILSKILGLLCCFFPSSWSLHTEKRNVGTKKLPIIVW